MNKNTYRALYTEMQSLITARGCGRLDTCEAMLADAETIAAQLGVLATEVTTFANMQIEALQAK